MNYLNKLFALLLLSLLFTGCASQYGGFFSNVTQVELNEANFTVIETVSGESSAVTFFGFGNKVALFQEAKRNMLNNANLIGSAKAITNLTADFDVRFYGPVIVYTMTVTADVVEFK